MRIPHRSWSTLGAVVIALAGALVACSGATEPDKQLDSLRSWQASVRLATSAVHLGWTPRRYGRQLHDQGASVLEESRKAKLKDASAADSAAIRGAQRALEASLDSLAAAAGS